MLVIDQGQTKISRGENCVGFFSFSGNTWSLPGLGMKGRGLEMPFPPGVGAKSGANGASAGSDSESFEVISAEKSLDERNVGNRMLRNMGWQEGLVSSNGLGCQLHRCMFAIGVFIVC